jgi:hypothetical protein
MGCIEKPREGYIGKGIYRKVQGGMYRKAQGWDVQGWDVQGWDL